MKKKSGSNTKNELSHIIKPLEDSIPKSLITPDQAGTEFSNLLKHKPATLNNLKDAKALKHELEKKARQKKCNV